ncbi:MAG: magnesium/cobalt transporter CorA [Planctomycetales bacterium]|nr:magnesium/cobalt transporter CorA [Planctomycetales bacterium]
MAHKRRNNHRARAARGRKPRRQFDHSIHPHTRPGTLIIPGGAKASKLRVTAYGPQQIVDRRDASLADVTELLGKHPVTWIDATGLGDIELIAALGKQLGLHPLSLEDLVNIPQRSKVDVYPDHLYVVTQIPSYLERLSAEQLSIFIGKGFVLSWREGGGNCFEGVRKRIEVAGGVTRSAGVDYLLYVLLDAAIDCYYPVMERFGDELDDFDERVDVGPDPELLNRIHHVRRDVRRLRRIVWPLREAVDSLMRQQEWLSTPETIIHLRDCHDHTVQIIDTLESVRDACADLRDYYATSISNRTNDIMKVLTVIATVFMPLSFIAGLYGMNFNTHVSPWNMPELGWRFGYPWALGLMGGVTVGQLIFFWRKGWLGGSWLRPGDDEDD